ncbi:hypothetical protein SAMN02745121_07337 [Nannocystis exedens]|uniref:Uncharacterized protein n=1 Tax=Nannocystis exedens TaxID=54 RepID=A0A1I2GJV8_9BACT|nr:hypothetical protein [Nannocystis exedens]PCC73589.1 hypothetical protein NAEX_06677 [Nannocystis exedens]SFF17528.1 hypothetical protein SAMN02745121_07337 [Nannocystis exedens]
MRAWLPPLLLLACAPELAPGDTDSQTTGTSTGTGEPTTSTTTAPTTGAVDMMIEAACLEDIHPGDLWPEIEPAVTCGGLELCPGDDPIVFELDGPGIWDDLSTPTSVETDLERARCLATALRDRTPGQFMFLPVRGREVLHLFGLEIVGELVVIRSERASCELIYPEPKSCHVKERLRVLRPPEYFADCVDGDALALWRCLLDAVEPEPACAPGPLSCPT